MDLAAAASLLAPCDVNRDPLGRVTGLSSNSKTVQVGELFFCLRGNFFDGHDFASDAVTRGAVALVVERFLPLDIVQIKVADTREAMLKIGREFFGNPAARLGLVGVTGTNGKTTTTFMIRSVLEQVWPPVGLIGTVHTQFAGAPTPSNMTTPDSFELWGLMAQAANEGCDWVVMEVSSHALAMHRADPADFDIGVVTNITRDHFDYHGTFEHYLQSKARMVYELPATPKEGRPRVAILNADDPNAISLAPGTQGRVVTYGLTAPADVTASEVVARVSGSDFLLHLPGHTPVQVHLVLPGIFNVSNALAAAAAGWVAGVPVNQIVLGLAECRHVPGRAELIDEGQDFQVVVDFAHNPDALAKVLSLTPDRPDSRRILVFGAEGGKDKGKRPQMGAAARAADYAIVTSDNVPKEEPADVAAQVAEGLAGHPHEIVLDRRKAIERALAMARTGDLVIVAGKGHEQTWVFEGKRIPFDDRAVVREILRQSGRVRLPRA